MLAVERPLERPAVADAAVQRSRILREALEEGVVEVVVVQRRDHLRILEQPVLQAGDVLGPQIRVEHDQVRRIHRTDRADRREIEVVEQPDVARDRLADQVVAENRGIVAVAARDLDPQRGRALHERALLPEVRLTMGAARVLVACLRARCRVQVEQHPQPVRAAERDRAFEQAEALLAPLTGREVGLELAVVERQPREAEALARQEGEVRVGDVRLGPGAEEGVGRRGAEDPAELLADLPLGPGQADHVVLDQHPAAKIHPAQAHGPVALQDLEARGLEDLLRTRRPLGARDAREERSGGAQPYRRFQECSSPGHLSSPSRCCAVDGVYPG